LTGILEVTGIMPIYLDIDILPVFFRFTDRGFLKCRLVLFDAGTI